MRLYILGNGFDIAHGLKTSYKEFRQYLINKNRDDILFLFPEEELWSDFEYNVCDLYHESFRKLVDEYNENSEYICKKIFDDISDEMALFLSEIECKSNTNYDIEKESLFFVFNYTHTLEKIYDVSPNRIFQPHGSVLGYQSFKEKLILGHHKKDYLVNPELIIGRYFDYYYNFSLYTEKPIDTIINSKNMMDFITSIEMNEIDEVLFYGFSYSVVDEDYIIVIKEKLNKNIPFLLGYYSQNDKTRALEFAKRLNLHNYRIISSDEILKPKKI